jgi:hypothetical protein
VRHRNADPAEQLNAFRDVVDEAGVGVGVFVEQEVQLIEGVAATCQ